MLALINTVFCAVIGLGQSIISVRLLQRRGAKPSPERTAKA